MEFCPKCGAVLIQKRKNDGCPRCNYSSKEKIKLTSSEKISEKKEIPVFTGKKLDVRPITNEKCKKCGHEKSYFWTVQTRSSDEAETKFFQCVKCGNTHKTYR